MNISSFKHKSYLYIFTKCTEYDHYRIDKNPFFPHMQKNKTKHCDRYANTDCYCFLAGLSAGSHIDSFIFMFKTKLIVIGVLAQLNIFIWIFMHLLHWHGAGRAVNLFDSPWLKLKWAATIIHSKSWWKNVTACNATAPRWHSFIQISCTIWNKHKQWPDFSWANSKNLHRYFFRPFFSIAYLFEHRTWTQNRTHCWHQNSYVTIISRCFQIKYRHIQSFFVFDSVELLWWLFRVVFREHGMWNKTRSGSFPTTAASWRNDV